MAEFQFHLACVSVAGEREQCAGNCVCSSPAASMAGKHRKNFSRGSVLYSLTKNKPSTSSNGYLISRNV